MFRLLPPEAQFWLTALIVKGCTKVHTLLVIYQDFVFVQDSGCLTSLFFETVSSETQLNERQNLISNFPGVISPSSYKYVCKLKRSAVCENKQASSKKGLVMGHFYSVLRLLMRLWCRSPHPHNQGESAHSPPLGGTVNLAWVGKGGRPWTQRETLQLWSDSIKCWQQQKAEDWWRSCRGAQANCFSFTDS